MVTERIVDKTVGLLLGIAVGVDVGELDAVDGYAGETGLWCLYLESGTRTYWLKLMWRRDGLR
jgi:hypothetical protein